MQLASYGARLTSRTAHTGSHHRSAFISPNAVRSIHIPPPHVHFSPHTTTNKLFSTSRNLLSRFFTHLTAPGLRAPNAVSSFSRSLYHGSNAARGSTIHQGFSLPVRHALSRPVQPHFVPRGPRAPVNRSTVQVGLGAARNFTSGRPIFQHLVDNVPVAGRAFYEADWEIKMRKERKLLRNKRANQQETTPSKGKETLKPLTKPTAMTLPSTSPKSQYESEMEHYFLTPAVPAVTTYLLIPLAPAPIARTPLSLDPTNQYSESHPLLPLPALGSMHSTYHLHSLRVHTLFSRLDAADVWARGAASSTYSQPSAGSTADGRGVCTVLRVEFRGWTKEEVRAVIGESGTGWCVLEEERPGEDSLSEILSENGSESGDDILEDTSSVWSGELFGNEFNIGDVGSGLAHIDPAQSVILPTLDFSSPFLDISTPRHSHVREIPPPRFGGELIDPWGEEYEWENVTFH